MKLTYRIHAWVGLITGVFVLIICVTGSFAVFKPEIDRAIELQMRIAIDPDAPRANLDDIWQRVSEQYDGTVTAVWLPAKLSSMFTHGNAISLWLSGKRPNPTEVLVHPNTGKIVYTRHRLDSWGQWLREFHKAMFYGYWGRVFVGALGVTLVASTVMGLIIFPRFNRGRWMPSIRWNRGSRILLGDLHKASGLITAALTLILASSGAVVGLENLYHRYWPDDDGDDQPRFVMPEPGPFMPGILEHSLAQAREAMPHAYPSRIIVPRGKRTVAIVTMEHPDHKLIKENASFVRSNAITGELIDMRDATQASAGTRLYYAMEPLHFGRLWGSLTVKLVYGLVGIAIGFLCVSGYIIYVARKVTAYRSRRARRAVAAVASTEQLADLAAANSSS
jgi:uncharacterized iron-regulated membrane protein